jgi:hypothetical protein
LQVLPQPWEKKSISSSLQHDIRRQVLATGQLETVVETDCLFAKLIVSSKALLTHQEHDKAE